MIAITILMLKAFNHVLEKQGINRAIRRRYMKAISNNPDELLSVYKELWGNK